MTPEKMSMLLKTRDRSRGCQALFISRTWIFRKDGKEIITKLPDSTAAVVHAGTAKYRDLLPEENREDEFIIVYSLFDLTEGKDPDSRHHVGADLIEPFPGGGRTWRVVRSKHWQDYGFYQALAVHTEEKLPVLRR